ncbi:DinB family protein [Grimontia sp. S25]|uniref:DinB family protein n=1 Tax=Grimontia sedimenti TaxID=2711294 RepID=A0A6M1RGV0_9GAMM|nr:DinB family protein [Grimontia sedimenti]NGN97521.1 DinB family protein [Grimontia sedimenti]
MLARDSKPSLNAPYAVELEGGLDVAAQALELLHQLSDDQYQFVATPYLQSSIGQHMRHILDVFHAASAQDIDYDVRRRAHPVETDRKIAMSEWRQLCEWLESLSEADMDSAINVRHEVSLNRQAAATSASTLGRELAFVSSHAVHHFALIRVSLSAQKISVAETFGLAPATLSHFRGEQ